MDNSLVPSTMFYLFSTISQVLGGFIALSGVFIIFKLQEIRKILLVKGKQFFQNIEALKALPFWDFDEQENYEKLRDSLELENTRAMIIPIEHIWNMLPKRNDAYNDTYVILEPILQIIRLIQRRRRLILGLSLGSILVGVLSILFSLVAISLVPRLHFYFLIMDIVLASISIILMTISIILSICEINLAHAKSTF
jgi:hypothetical protein